MKIASCFLYVLFTIIYTGYAKSTMLWFGFGQLTLLLFVCILGYFAISNKCNTEGERLFLSYSILLTIGRAAYTIYCVFADDKIVIYNTDVFHFIAYVTFTLLLFDCAIKYKST